MIRISKIKLLIAAALCLPFIAASPAVADIYVSPTGNDTSCANGGGSGNACATVSKAFSLVNDGGTVFCQAGSYPATTLSRAFTSATTLSGDDCEIAGLTFANTSARIIVVGANLTATTNLSGAFNTLSGVNVTNPSGTCIRIRGGNGNPANSPVVTGSDIHDCRRGIDTPYTGSGTTNTAGDDVLNPVVADNHIHGMLEDGIAIGDWTDGLIEDNVIADVQDPTGVLHNDGIQFFGGIDGIQVLGNTVKDEDSNGISSDTQGFLLQSAGSNEPNTDMDVEDNTITDTTGVAAQMDASGQIIADGNIFCGGKGLTGNDALAGFWVWPKYTATIYITNNHVSDQANTTPVWVLKSGTPTPTIGADTGNVTGCTKQTYKELVTADGATDYYPGTTADGIGSNNGTAVGSPPAATGPFGAQDGWSFDGSTQRIDLPTNDWLGIGDRVWSFDGWVKWPSTATGNRMMFTFSSSTATVPVVFVGSGTTNPGAIRVSIRPDSAAGYDYTTSATGFNDNVWHHVAATVSTSGVTVYADGSTVLSAPAPPTGTYTVSRSCLAALCRSGIGNYWSGSEADFAFYNSTLTAAQVAAHANFQP